MKYFITSFLFIFVVINLCSLISENNAFDIETYILNSAKVGFNVLNQKTEVYLEMNQQLIDNYKIHLEDHPIYGMRIYYKKCDRNEKDRKFSDKQSKITIKYFSTIDKGFSFISNELPQLIEEMPDISDFIKFNEKKNVYFIDLQNYMIDSLFVYKNVYAKTNEATVKLKKDYKKKLSSFTKDNIGIPLEIYLMKSFQYEIKIPYRIDTGLIGLLNSQETERLDEISDDAIIVCAQKRNHVIKPQREINYFINEDMIKSSIIQYNNFSHKYDLLIELKSIFKQEINELTSTNYNQKLNLHYEKIYLYTYKIFNTVTSGIVKLKTFDTIEEAKNYIGLPIGNLHFDFFDNNYISDMYFFYFENFMIDKLEIRESFWDNQQYFLVAYLSEQGVKNFSKFTSQVIGSKLGYFFQDEFFYSENTVPFQLILDELQLDQSTNREYFERFLRKSKK